MDSMHSTLNMYYDYSAHVKGGAFSDYILKVLRIILVILPEHQSDTQVITVKMEILLEPTSNKLMVAGNLVKEILLKLNLPDHRILKDGGEVKEFQRSFRHSDTERLSRSDEVLKLKNFKKDATLKLFKSTNQERYEHVGPEVTSSQDGKVYKMAKRDYAWLMISRIVLRVEKKLNTIEQPIPPAPVLKSMFEKQAGVERFNLIQTFHACKQEEGQSVSSFFLKMKSYLEQLEHLDYVFPQNISVGLILNGLTNNFACFVRNYNMLNMGKTNGELHALLIEYENSTHGLGGEWKLKQGAVYLKKRIEKMQHDRLLKSTDDESIDQCISCLSGKMTRKPFPHQTERAIDLLGLIHTDVCGLLRHVSRQGASYFITFTDYFSRYGYVYLLKHKHEVFKTFKVWGCEALVKRGTPEKLQQRSIKCIFVGYPKETMGYYIYFSPKNKIVVARYAEFFKKNLISQEAKVEEHSLGDLNAPTNYKAALLDLECSKGLDAMNAEMQSMKDNQVWRLVDLPPNAKTVGSK
ncbi:retrotransposon protein, putative, ty1-copia subclass [Tanacetum coccineum]